MSRNVRPLNFDPQSPDEREDREFFEGRQRGESPSSVERINNTPAAPDPSPTDPDITVETLERFDLIDKRGRLEEGSLFEKRESQRVVGNGARKESAGRLYESSYGRVIRSPEEIAGRCQRQNLWGGMCGALIHKEELERATCRICGIHLCRRHVRLSESGKSYCRKHKHLAANTEEERQAGDSGVEENVPCQTNHGLLKRILIDTFTMPAED